MIIRQLATTAALCLVTTASMADGVKSKAQDTVDPDCTVSKAAKGAAMKSTVGVGNRCDVSETARDVTGTDGKAKSVRKKVSE